MPRASASSALRSASGEAMIASSTPALDPFVRANERGVRLPPLRPQTFSCSWTESWQWRQAGLLVRTARKGRVRFLLRPRSLLDGEVARRHTGLEDRTAREGRVRFLHHPLEIDGRRRGEVPRLF
jgi:hypothetical protein